MKQMWILFVAASFILLNGCVSKDGFPVLKGPYLGQKPPGMTPELFAPDLFSDFKYTFCSVFSPDGNEYYFATAKSEDDNAGIYWMRRLDDQWTQSEPAPFNSPEINHDMRLSTDGSKIYFQSWRPLPGSNTPDKTGCLWFSKRIQGGWGKPKPIKCGGKVLRAGYPDISRNGTLYFSTRDKNTKNVDIHRSRWINGAYTPPENLGKPINTEYIEGDLCISPDERFIVVAGWERPENTGGGHSDLYVSFKQNNNTWTKLINMGIIINTRHIENCPTISPDGKYFFFQRFDGVEKSETYWVDAKVIEDLEPDASTQELIPLRAERLSERVLFIKSGHSAIMSNATAIATSRGMVVIDSHYKPECGRRIRSIVEETFLRDDFTHLIYTHAGVDHMGGASASSSATPTVYRVSRDFDKGCKKSISGTY